ncbi:hypothetical protein J6590_063997 [Homalodisca vitripennis]|nr:hypothetical protein J6590_063997 [Homalodisca vitripennis]
MEDEIKQFGKCKTTAFSHCISADALDIRHFGRPSHSDFVNSHLTCQVPDGSATVYSLVTKPKYDTKPTSYDFAQAFAQLQEDLKKRNLKELICSPMGCVRDKISVEDFAAKIVNFQLNTGANVKIVTFEQPTAERILFNGYSHSEFIKSLQHFISMQYQNRAATYTTPAELSGETGNTTVECKQAPTCAVLSPSLLGKIRWMDQQLTSHARQWPTNRCPLTQQASGLPTRQSRDTVDGQTINPPTQQASGLPTRQSSEAVDGQIINPPTQQANGPRIGQTTDTLHNQDNDASDESSEVVLNEFLECSDYGEIFLAKHNVEAGLT